MHKKIICYLITLAFYSYGMDAPLSRDVQKVRMRRHSFPTVLIDRGTFTEQNHYAELQQKNLIGSCFNSQQQIPPSKMTNNKQEQHEDSDISDDDTLLTLKQVFNASKNKIVALENLIEANSGLIASFEQATLAKDEYIRSLEELIRTEDRLKRIYLKLAKHYAYFNGTLLFLIGTQLSRTYKNGKYLRLGTGISALLASVYTYSHLPKNR